MRRIVIQREDFDPSAVLAELEQTAPGAIASFTGLVRSDDGIAALTLEHYPGMTEMALSALVDRAVERWPLSGVVLIHRIGPLSVGDHIVHVVCASDHRAAALEACAFLIDQLKTNAPFWKREDRADGSGRWVEAKDTDETAADRWDAAAPDRYS
jgi:molybdopterin synthase catalytic subunit